MSFKVGGISSRNLFSCKRHAILRKFILKARIHVCSPFFGWSLNLSGPPTTRNCRATLFCYNLLPYVFHLSQWYLATSPAKPCRTWISTHQQGQILPIKGCRATVGCCSYTVACRTTVGHLGVNKTAIRLTEKPKHN